MIELLFSVFLETERIKVIYKFSLFQSARQIAPPEATWRIYIFPLKDMHPYVASLQLHLCLDLKRS